MKSEKKGFTIVELLTSIAIIALLLGILLPSLNAVRKMAKQASQKAQFMALETGLLGYRNDMGEYPPSSPTDNAGYNENGDYCGAQKLAEAMVGLDLMGFHPNSVWRADGQGPDPVTGNLVNLYYPTAAQADVNLKQRKSQYIELEKANVFQLSNYGGVEGIFNLKVGSLLEKTYVICDVFGIRKMIVGDKTIKAGTPILYFKANTTSKTMYVSAAHEKSIYNFFDNKQLMADGGVLTSNGAISPTEIHAFIAPSKNLNEGDVFYSYEKNSGISDSRMNIAWPHRPDSYILISAGPDGLYGTSDDVRNFDN